jgi:hypothetical protein
MFRVVIILLLDIAISLVLCCCLASFTTFLTILQYLIQCLRNTDVCSEAIHTSSVLARYFYSLCNAVIFFTLLCITGKVTWKMYKKVHSNELSI